MLPAPMTPARRPSHQMPRVEAAVGSQLFERGLDNRFAIVEGFLHVPLRQPAAQVGTVLIDQGKQFVRVMMLKQPEFRAIGEGIG